MSIRWKSATSSRLSTMNHESLTLNLKKKRGEAPPMQETPSMQRTPLATNPAAP
jgi:hypothetical protein